MSDAAPFLATEPQEVGGVDPMAYFYHISSLSEGTQALTCFMLPRSASPPPSGRLDQAIAQADWEHLRRQLQVVKFFHLQNEVRDRRSEIRFLRSRAIRATPNVSHMTVFTGAPEYDWYAQEFVGRDIKQDFRLFQEDGLDRRGRGRLAWELIKQAMEIVAQVQDGSGGKGIAHGDLVGMNICLQVSPPAPGSRKKGDVLQAKLIDYGKGRWIPRGLQPYRAEDARYDPAYLAHTIHNAYHPAPYRDNWSTLPMRDPATRKFCQCRIPAVLARLTTAQRADLRYADRDLEHLLERMCHAHDPHQFTAAEVVALCETRFRHKFRRNVVLPAATKRKFDADAVLPPATWVRRCVEADLQGQASLARVVVRG